MRIAGLGCGTQDLIVTASDRLIETVFFEHGLKCEGVQFIEDRSLLMNISRDLKRIADSQQTEGGTISNTLFSLASLWSRNGGDGELFWLGSAEYSDFAGSTNPVDYLRQVKITLMCRPALLGSRLAVSAVSAETGDVKSVLIFDNLEPLSFLTEWPSVDILLTSISVIAQANEDLFEYVCSVKALALLVADLDRIDAATLTRLTYLARSDRLKWIFGHFEDFSRLALLGGEGNPAEQFKHVEFVGTAGVEPVHIWDSHSGNFLEFEVERLEVMEGNSLGAGDAYAGGYLSARIEGHEIAQSHKRGLQSSTYVLGSHLSYSRVRDNLNDVFGQGIDRVSIRTDEGSLFDLIRHAPGIVAISCGQTGVDQIALQTANSLGLPSFAILPLGNRTEHSEGIVPGEDDFGDAYVIELGSASYRYCTWVNAYLSDGTLLWDYHNSEGSQATREACRALGRPFLDIANIHPDELATKIIEWAARHNIRVINFAGNRSRLLGAAEQERVKHQANHIMRCLAWNWAQLSAGTATPLHLLHESMPSLQSYGSLRIGVSKDSAIQEMFYGFLSDMHGIPTGQPRKLCQQYSELGLTLFFARARDLPTMLQRGLVDVIVCGSDLLDEDALECRTLVRTGLQPCHIVMVGAPGVELGRKARIRVGSQYPHLSRRLLQREGYRGIAVVPIRGAAEAWISTGYVNAAIDTWRTGYTASVNELQLLKTFYSTSLVLATFANENHSMVNLFKKHFEHWLIHIRSQEE